MKQNNGFTVIEVLVSAALLVILGAGFLGLQYIFSRNQTIAWQSYINIEEANRAAMIMARELRNMNESEDGSFPLSVSDDQQIIFYSDIDYDDLVDRVRYTLNGNTLLKGITPPQGEPAEYLDTNETEQIITDYVRNGSEPVFYYYNENWPSDTVNNPLPIGERISDTSMIHINLIINSNEDDPDSNYVIKTEILARELR